MTMVDSILIKLKGDPANYSNSDHGGLYTLSLIFDHQYTRSARNKTKHGIHLRSFR